MKNLSSVVTRNVLKALAKEALKHIPTHAYVATGVADWDPDKQCLTEPDIVTVEGAEDYSTDTKNILEARIIAAAASITADDVEYDYRLYPVFMFGIEGVGVVFVAVETKLSADIYYGMTATVDLKNKLEAKLTRDADIEPEEITWRYGVLVNHRVFVSYIAEKKEV